MAKTAKKARRRPKPSPRVPPYISPALAARACKVSRYRATTLMRHAGILEKIGERWYAGASALRDQLPELYEAIYEHVVLSGDDEAGSERG